MSFPARFPIVIHNIGLSKGFLRIYKSSHIVWNIDKLIVVLATYTVAWM
jgi:hypothetical protein